MSDSACLDNLAIAKPNMIIKMDYLSIFWNYLALLCEQRYIVDSHLTDNFRFLYLFSFQSSQNYHPLCNHLPLPRRAKDVRPCLVSVFLMIDGSASITGIESVWEMQWQTRDRRVSNSIVDDFRDNLELVSRMMKWSTTKPCSQPSFTDMAVLLSLWLHLRTIKF